MRMHQRIDPSVVSRLAQIASKIGVAELAARIPVHRATLSRLIHGHVARPSMATMECIERTIDDIEFEEQADAR